MNPTTTTRSTDTTTTRSTDEPGLARWDRARAAARPWSPDRCPLVVVAPHPDDESLSVGGLIALQRCAGVRVSVVAVTDGDAAYSAAGDPGLARLRRAEQREALALLGVADNDCTRLGVPDGGVAEHEDTIADHLVSIGSADTVLVAPSPFDVHPDHEAVGRAAAVAAQRLGCTLLSYLFWAWHRSESSALVGRDLVALELTPDIQRRKWSALARHSTQLECWNDHDPVLLPELIAPATWSHEYFVIEQP